MCSFLAGLLLWAGFAMGTATNAQEPDRLGYEIKLETVLKHDETKFQWYHPRVAAIPRASQDGKPTVIMTLLKHLHASDHYSGTYVMRSDDLGLTWSKPDGRPELDWVKESDKVDIGIADVTPGWHAKTGKVIAIGCQSRYDKKGRELYDKPRSDQTSYAVHDPKTGDWSTWKLFEMPADEKFNSARSACSQFVIRPDGAILMPVYFGRSSTGAWGVTVVQASFDGKELKYQKHGTELELKVVRGLVEPSLVKFQNKYYLTLRNDVKGYVSVSDDGLNYAPIKAWTFDDGKDLGSYNTQQHWLAHSDALFLVYTRKGANNDHIIRHRAPLFIAQVDPEKLHVIRKTERVLIPERGGEYGNFGAAVINERESWVTVGEGIWSKDARKRGAEGALFVARVIWSKPNKAAP